MNRTHTHEVAEPRLGTVDLAIEGDVDADYLTELLNRASSIVDQLRGYTVTRVQPVFLRIDGGSDRLDVELTGYIDEDGEVEATVTVPFYIGRSIERGDTDD